MTTFLTSVQQQRIVIPDGLDLNALPKLASAVKSASVLDVQVSAFTSYQSVEPKTVNLLDWLTSTEYAAEIIELRSISSKSKRDWIKASLPAVTVSGLFAPTRKEQNLVQHSGLICLDIDAKGNEHITNFADLKTQLFRLENVAYTGLSASGKGFFLIIPIAHPMQDRRS